MGRADLGILRAFLELNSAQFSRSAEKAKQSMSELEKKMVRTLNVIDRAGKKISNVGAKLSKSITLPALAAGAGILALTKRSADFADRIDKAALRTGLARRELQKLDFAAGQADINFESLTKGVGNLQTMMFDSTRGMKTAQDNFDDLGISVLDSNGKLKEANEVLPEVIDALRATENETTRNALAMSIFGQRVGREFLPLLDRESASLGELTGEFEKNGNFLSDEGIKALVGYKDSMARVTLAIETTTAKIGAALAPVLEKTLIPLLEKDVVPLLSKVAEKLQLIGDWFSELTPEVQRGATMFGVLAVALPPIVWLVGKLTSAFANLGKFILKFATIFISAIKGLASVVAIKIAAIIGVIATVAEVVYLVIRNFQALKGFFGSVWDRIIIIFSSAIEKIVNLLADFFSFLGLDKIEKALDGVSQKITEVGESARESLDKNVFADFGVVVSTMQINLKRDFDKIKSSITDWTGFGKKEIDEITDSTENFGKKVSAAANELPRLNKEIEKVALRTTELEIKPITVDITSLSMEMVQFGEAMNQFGVDTLESTQMFLSAIHSAVIQGGATLKEFGGVVIQEARRFISAKIAEAVIAYAASALKTLPPPFGLVAAGIAAGAAAALMNTLASGLLPMKHGGIITQPTPVLVGESGTEVIFPLSKLKDFIGDSRPSHIIVTGEIQGENIRLSNQRTEKYRGKYL